MGGRTIRGIVLLGVAVLVLVAVGSALGVKKVAKIRIQAGDIVVNGEGGFTPTALPKNVDAPITLFGRGRISTVSGDYPPVLETIGFEFDKHGSVDITGLPKCSVAKLEATTVPQARKLCPGAIVGKGQGSAVVVFPEQAPISANSPITLFNGPRIGGDPSVLAHAHLTVPPRPPSSSRSGSKRSTTAATGTGSRLASPKSLGASASPSPAPCGSAATGPSRARSTATSTPVAPTGACRRWASSASKTTRA